MKNLMVSRGNTRFLLTNEEMREARMRYELSSIAQTIVDLYGDDERFRDEDSKIVQDIAARVLGLRDQDDDLLSNTIYEVMQMMKREESHAD